MRISRFEPIATSKRVRNAAPLRQRFSLEVSSSKVTPRESRPRTRMGRCTAILRSERCLATVLLTGTMGWVLTSAGSHPAGASHFVHARNPGGSGRSALKKTLYAREDFAGRSRRVYDSAKLAAVPHALSKPASELLHFANSVGRVGHINSAIVVNQ